MKISPIPQSLTCKAGKNDHLVWDGTFRLDERFWSINQMTETEEEPHITYGGSTERHLTWIYNLRISYPKRDILLLECDVKSCHRQCKLHPDIAGGFSFIVGQLLYVPVGNVFGGVTSASSWEPFRRAIITLSRKYWNNDTLVAKHRKFLNMLNWDISSDK